MAGQVLYVAPRDQQPTGVRGWLLASNGTAYGLVPTNYIRIFQSRPANNPNSSSVMHRQQGEDNWELVKIGTVIRAKSEQFTLCCFWLYCYPFLLYGILVSFQSFTCRECGSVRFSISPMQIWYFDIQKSISKALLPWLNMIVVWSDW